MNLGALSCGDFSLLIFNKHIFQGLGTHLFMSAFSI